jgi:hypothetical protein
MNNEKTHERFKAFTATECSEVSSDQPYEDGVVIQRLKLSASSNRADVSSGTIAQLFVPIADSQSSESL